MGLDEGATEKPVLGRLVLAAVLLHVPVGRVRHRGVPVVPGGVPVVPGGVLVVSRWCPGGVLVVSWWCPGGVLRPDRAAIQVDEDSDIAG